MAEPITRVTLFVPGAPAAAARSLEGPFESEWIENDGAFGQAFSFGTVEPDGVAAINAAPGALIVNSQVDLLDGRVRANRT